ncbi:MAG: DNA ligase, partial [Planctomycetaceae bacterium]
MTDLADGDSVEMQGSGSKPYVLKNTGGVYSGSCPAWRNQSIAIERRTCKHLKKLRGEAAELARIGTPPTAVDTPAGAVDDTEGEPSDKSLPLLLAERWTGETDIA